MLPPPSTGRTLTPFGSGRLLDLDRTTGSYRIWAPCVSCAMGGGDPLPGASLLYDSPGGNFSAFAGAGIAHVGADEVMAYGSDASSFWRLAPSAEALRAAVTGLPAGGGGSGEAESFPPRRTPHALPALELLIAHGADVDKPSNDGSTPVKAARAAGYDDVADLLIGAGARDGKLPFVTA